MRAIDTNVLVRAFVQDDSAQAKRALDLLKIEAVFVPVTVVLELEWVLRSRYGFESAVIAQIMAKMVTLENLLIGERDAVAQAAARLAQGWGFADALHHALSHGCIDFVTFDADLLRRSRRVAEIEPPITRL